MPHEPASIEVTETNKLPVYINEEVSHIMNNRVNKIVTIFTLANLVAFIAGFILIKDFAVSAVKTEAEERMQSEIKRQIDNFDLEKAKAEDSMVASRATTDTAQKLAEDLLAR